MSDAPAKLTVDGLELTLIRSDRRSLSLQLTADGSVVARAPRRMSEKRVVAFVREKRGWIEEKQALARKRDALYAPVELKDGAALPYLGGSLTLRFTRVRAPKREGETLLLPPGADEETLRRWLREEARSLIEPRAASYASLMGLEYAAIRITSAQTRWGSCSGKNSLNFTWRLAMCAPEAIDYVVVHELSHIRHKDHSRAFWALVERWCPDWRTQRQWLRDHRKLMEIL